MDAVIVGLLANTDRNLDRLVNHLLGISLLDFSQAPEIVNLSDATEDYALEVAEIAYISFSDATQVPLHIATPNNSCYELHVIPSNTGGTSGGTDGNVFLYPNNTTYSNAFYTARLTRDGQGFSHDCPQTSAFIIGRAFSVIAAWITNRTQYKNVRTLIDYYGIFNSYPGLRATSSDWRDTTTEWTSLGTIVFPQSTSGEILVFRAR